MRERELIGVQRGARSPPRLALSLSLSLSLSSSSSSLIFFLTGEERERGGRLLRCDVRRRRRRSCFQVCRLPFERERPGSDGLPTAQSTEGTDPFLLLLFLFALRSRWQRGYPRRVQSERFTPRYPENPPISVPAPARGDRLSPSPFPARVSHPRRVSHP